VLNWIWRGLDTNDKKPNPVSIIFGIIQTALYLDFAWVYWSRQRVKLRNGGVVDADDLSRGWLLRRIFGNKQFARDIDGHGEHGEGEDEESAPALGGRGGFNHHEGGGGGGGGGGGRPKWGSRGISISADEGVLEHERERGRFGDDDDDEEHGVTDVVDPDAKMRDPDELAKALDEDEDLDAAAAAAGQSSSQQKDKKSASPVPKGMRNGDEWDDD
jgi:hypothetical protein